MALVKAEPFGLVVHRDSQQAGASSSMDAGPPPMGPPLSELLLPEEGLDRVLRQGWELVPTGLSESPPPLVGATLNCLEVPLHAKGVKAAEEDQLAQLAAEGPQYGLFLFGGDDE